jgi:BirA family biotin operon repressor/biotin-[acetyl-CoA-carboxylase] ligase
MRARGWLGAEVRRLAVCGSTNDEAAAWARAGAPHGALVLADAQTRGRGRLGRPWHSPPGESLYLSMVLRPSPEVSPARASAITLSAGAAVAEALDALGVDPALKWPNDVLLGGKKVCGILTEMATRGAAIAHLVVGLGLNVSARAFPPPLEQSATSLLAAGRSIDREALLAALLPRLEGAFERFFAEGTPAACADFARFARFGQPVTVDGAPPLAGVAVGLDEDGALLVRDADGATHRVLSGDVRPA